MTQQVSRREMLFGSGAVLAGAMGISSNAQADDSEAQNMKKSKPKFRYCLNTSTIRGQKLPLLDIINLASSCGYDAIEPWIREIDAYLKEGGTLKELNKRIKDKGLTVEDAIGFPSWIVDDETERAKGFDEAKRCMEMIQQIGCKRLAAPPFGATDKTNIDLFKAADRYRQLLELGDTMGIVPQVELWGFSKTLGRLGETAVVAIEAHHPKACVLVDVYHLYKGGSEFNGVKQLSGAAMQVFHMNDYPASIPREKIIDAQRVYPGDGDAPLTQLFQDLHSIGFNGVLSLELFNPEYWKQDAKLVAKTGLEKMKAAVKKAFA